jgi:cytochrome c-type biogenesis protein
MDAETLRQAVAQVGFSALWAALVTGFVFSFNPVALAAIPVTLAYVTTSRSKRQATLYSGLFVLGMILTHVVLGLAVSLGGGWVQHLLGRAWGLLLGPLLIVLGLIWLGWLRGNDFNFDRHHDTSCKLFSSAARMGQSSVAAAPPSQR